MGYNHGLAEKIFAEEWARHRKEYAEAGMSRSAIREIYRFDRGVFNETRSFYEKSQRYPTGSIHDDSEGIKKNHMISGYEEQFRIEDVQTDQDREDWWIDELESEELIRAVQSLSEKDIELVTLLSFENRTEEDIAELWGVSQQAVSKRLMKIRRAKNKKVLKRGCIFGVFVGYRLEGCFLSSAYNFISHIHQVHSCYRCPMRVASHSGGARRPGDDTYRRAMKPARRYRMVTGTAMTGNRDNDTSAQPQRIVMGAVRGDTPGSEPLMESANHRPPE